MKNKQIFSIVAFVAMMILAPSCSKDDNDPAPAAPAAIKGIENIEIDFSGERHVLSFDIIENASRAVIESNINGYIFSNTIYSNYNGKTSLNLNSKVITDEELTITLYGEFNTETNTDKIVAESVYIVGEVPEEAPPAVLYVSNVTYSTTNGMIKFTLSKPSGAEDMTEYTVNAYKADETHIGSIALYGMMLDTPFFIIKEGLVIGEQIYLTTNVGGVFYSSSLITLVEEK
ncbi:MAG: hypothetical protein JEZ09_19840 [Salinivirgaceae bacterium]|nr:hypothetical protein [Salinivirgaceae bacterium]